MRKWIKFIFNNFGLEQFNPGNTKENIKTLIAWNGNALDATLDGKLILRESKFLWWLKNLVTFGAYQSWVKKVILYTFISYSIEIYNPFNKKILNNFLHRKIELMERLLKKIPWNKEKVEFHIDRFKRGSLLQQHIIENMTEAVSKQKPQPLIHNINDAMKKGVHPILITKGLSGAYFMRNKEREIVGVFKPFDEEIFAPNNPIGPQMQGALGQRAAYPGIRVGEGVFREVAAFLVDQFFGFGIVPKTYFAKFTHPVFFLAREQIGSRKIAKTKMGSFQEFIAGFTSLSDQRIQNVDVIELQLLACLDVIIGNLDRNTGNILINEGKIAAIDHGLCFSDLPEDLCTWYWENLEGGKEPLSPNLIKLFNEFPFEKLTHHLKDRSFLTNLNLARMKERIILFREGLKKAPHLHKLARLMSEEYLFPLMGLDATLEEQAKEQVAQYFNRPLA